MTTTSADEIHRTGIERELACRLTDEQLLEVALHKAELEDKHEALEAELADVKASYKRRTEELEALIAEDRQVLKSRTVTRVVECFERWRGNVLEIVRSDTGEVIDTRTPTLRDTQRVVPGTEEPAEASKPCDEQLAGDAARTQADAGVAEDDEGDVIPIESADGSKRRRKRR